MGYNLFEICVGSHWPWCWPSRNAVVVPDTARRPANGEKPLHVLENPTPSDEPGSGQTQGPSYVRTAAMSPGPVFKFTSQARLDQFTGDDIEEIAEYHGVKHGHADPPSFLFAAKTESGIRVGKSDWQTFINAKGAKDAVEENGESLEELESKYGEVVWWEAIF
ncbi:hypothetical protein ACJ73_02466 [Blastomyces percursus]|uniref:Uncharacterized protein n=1 Tax=Blastomyces percursus TaxID=1658174 RepID=A0A1J9RDT0_9EURO|nr:hypothetical protein ACJ73_02466 [Blastomyces percursus]